MDFLSSKRFVTTALVLLAILNVTLLGVLWWQNFVSSSYRSVEITRYYRDTGHRGRELDLTDRQRVAFGKLRREHFRKTMPAVQKIIELKKEMISEAVKPNPDQAKIAAIADSLGKRQSWLEKDLALHFHELAALCTPAQRDSLEKLLNNIYTVRYQKMSSWRGRPHRDGRDDGRNRPMPPPPSEP
ncbi:periplasmic heavy metal sensor [Chlorobaculum sp. 24CR]|jgi:Spy/CpxP family protein refolding chaperone|uniref:Spy/CpxP family protein refolding chaperone n=1 Tax=Chlorobaculum sp. 24CR TaxID=2508878 RepID=UPI00100BDACB|nr:periplasmic heavy metal sensor [Chlorobaculum sp. 24CR]RXK88672.1 periplasmic heavy metal sensor [Chlorobaculum sp. 24CR]